MKPRMPEVNTTTNFDGETFQATLNQKKLSSVMQILIKNYNHPDLATLREWVSNAHDSHKAAGVKKPVKVTLPNRFDSTLTVEDFGLGMSYDEVRHVYLDFLNSTKDLDDKGIGGFGIGGKSALAISDQYTMVAVKDGVKNVFIFERSSTGGLDVKTVVRDRATDEPNGVKVSVVAGGQYSFATERVNPVLHGWRADELEVVGGEFESFYNNVIEFPHGAVSADVLTSGDKSNRGYGFNRRNGARVMVGPVAYPLPDHIMNEIWRDNKLSRFVQSIGQTLALKVPIGSVSFSYSREVIENEPENNKVLMDAFRSLYSEFQEYVDKQVKSLPDIKTAWEFANSPFVRNTGLNVTYKGRTLSQITYSGVKAFYLQHDGSMVKFYEVDAKKPIVKISPAAAKVIVKISKDDSELSAETIRKYIRTKVAEIFIQQRNSGKAYANSNHWTVLVTTESDDLYSITSEVFDFAELRKMTPKTTEGSSRTRISDIEAKDRAKAEPAFYVDKGELVKGRIGDRLEGVEKPILMRHTGASYDYTSSSALMLIAELFGVADRIVLVDNKRAIITVRRVYKDALTFEEFRDSLTEADLAVARDRMARLAALFAVGPFSDHGAQLARHKKAGLLNANAEALFEDDLLPLLDLIKNTLDRYSFIHSTEASSTLIKKLAEGHDFSRRQRSGLFSLMQSGAGNSEEYIDYINWSADRYAAKRAEA